MAERRLVICKTKTKTSDATFATANIIITAKTVLWGHDGVSVTFQDMTSVVLNLIGF